MRSDWDTVKLEANKLARKWNVPSHFENKRVSLTKKLADELISDQRLRDPEKRFKTEVFLKNIDIIFSQLQVRFKAVNEINILFRCLTPEILNKNDIADNELLKMADLLVEAYPDDISPSLGGQILRMKICFAAQMRTKKNIRDVTEMLLCNSQASSSFNDAIVAGLIFLTLPVTVASAERSFSKLKLIKTYLRSTMSQFRLAALAVLSIERARAKKLNTDSIINEFARQKVRKMSFS